MSAFRVSYGLLRRLFNGVTLTGGPDAGGGALTIISSGWFSYARGAGPIFSVLGGIYSTYIRDTFIFYAKFFTLGSRLSLDTSAVFR